MPSPLSTLFIQVCLAGPVRFDEVRLKNKSRLFFGGRWSENVDMGETLLMVARGWLSLSFFIPSKGGKKGFKGEG